MTTFQVVSDLHLEFNEFSPYDWVKTADNLIIVGDSYNERIFSSLINFINLLEAWSDSYKHIFVINGNHEYYNQSLREGDDNFKNLFSDRHNIHFLQKETIILNENILIAGCTLWSHVSNDHLEEIQLRMRDCDIIKDFEKDYIKYNKVHDDHVAWIKETIKYAKDNKLIIVMCTHHCPLKTREALVDFYGDDLNDAFATDLSDLVKQCDYWCYGHLHTKSNVYKHEQCTMVTNCRGYFPGSKVLMNETLTIEI